MLHRSGRGRACACERLDLALWLAAASKSEPKEGKVPLICINDRIAELGSIRLDVVRALSGAEIDMAFKISGNLGDKKPFFRITGR